MAKDTNGQPMTFDAAGQSYARDAASTVGNANSLSTAQTIYVKAIDIHTGAAGGSYEVLDIAGGRSLTGVVVLGANAKHQTGINSRVKGIYIESFGADGEIRVFTGPPNVNL